MVLLYRRSETTTFLKEANLTNSICILRLSAIGDDIHVIPAVVLDLQEQIPGQGEDHLDYW